MCYTDVIRRLSQQASAANVAGMARFGINPQGTLGVSMPALRKIAKEIGRDHALAQRLWDSGIHEGRILASLVADPTKLSKKLMENWVRDLDSWDICDQCCMNLFAHSIHAHAKAIEWSTRRREYVKRAGFVLMARLAVSDKNAPDSVYRTFFPIIEREAVDERNYVKKAVNWALRQIGKRNRALNREAIKLARKLRQSEPKSARWVGGNALHELTSNAVQGRLCAGSGAQ